MVWLGMLALALGMLVLRQSLVLVLAMVTVYIHVFVADGKVEYLIQDFWFAADREVLLSIPLFMLAGNVMSRGSIARRLVNFMHAFTSPIPGGLAVAAVLSCAAFAAINGSSIVTMLAIGSIMYPALTASGYSERFAVGAIASAGTLGIIIPPSIPLILYGIMTDVNIAHLFLAGVGPGLLLMAMFAGYSFWVNRKMPREPFSAAGAWRATLGGILAIALPVIMMGGIYTGRFSPTEAGAVALAYALVIEFFVHARAETLPAPAGTGPVGRLKHHLATREMDLRLLGTVVLETSRLLAILLPLLCIASSLNTILDHSGAPKQMVQHLIGNIDSPWVIMVGINLLLLVAGCVMDVGSAILIFAPLLKPLAQSIGVDPVHFGIIMISNLEIGYLTPPVGLNLIVAMAAFKVSFGTVIRSVQPFIAIMAAWLVLVIVYPAISLFLLR
ncbi:TRAP transporter large permease [Pseudorhodoferax soli]|uniref:C4-dicarboxylate transporter DctM subunit n=1 Tax=Pseudorhodoferax soli TaxID=545864 RepID=A0A368Y5M7_9BURK|nr:TRAP transporter large permease subunit [Pseudorhodoferax soli]RCW75571.1 C4-dicarboxylate transporter DctM subunit [Pseudorhodoferax soli]